MRTEEVVFFQLVALKDEVVLGVLVAGLVPPVLGGMCRDRLGFILVLGPNTHRSNIYIPFANIHTLHLNRYQ